MIDTYAEQSNIGVLHDRYICQMQSNLIYVYSMIDTYAEQSNIGVLHDRYICQMQSNPI